MPPLPWRLHRSPAAGEALAMNRLTILPALLVLSLAAACGDGSTSGADPCAGKSMTAGTRDVVIQSGGLERRFVLTVPESAVDGQPAPLVLGYHGVLSTPEAFLAVSDFPAKAAAEGFIVAAGAGVERSWNAGVCCDPAAAMNIDDVQFSRDMAAAIESEYCIDPEQIFATGFSNGGAMTFRLACQAADLFAATSPVAGGIASSCEPERDRSVLIVQNVDDPVVPFVLGEVAFDQLTGVNGCTDERVTTEPASNTVCDAAPVCGDGTTTELCAVSGISHVWPGGATDPNGPFRATDEIWEFFDLAS